MESGGTNTIYINNLNEKVKIKELEMALSAVFRTFGEIVSIKASKNLKMRGQAFVAFKRKEDAVTALNSMQGFPLYDKPLRIQMAKYDSDCVAKLKGTYNERKKEISNNRNNDKKLQKRPCQIVKPLLPVSNANVQPSYSLTNEPLGIQPGVNNQNSISSALPPTTPYREEPHNILFLTNLPHNTNQMMLNVLFGGFPGFKEIRTVPERPEIAFVEFADVLSAESAKNAFQGFKFDPNHATINIVFAKK